MSKYRFFFNNQFTILTFVCALKFCSQSNIDNNTSIKRSLSIVNGVSQEYTFFDPQNDISDQQVVENNDDINTLNYGINSFNNAFTNVAECGTRTVKFQQRHRRGRIIGGYEAPYGAFPWQVEIQLFDINKKKFKHLCGGALIHEKIVLTAAHCVQLSQPEYLRLVLGNHLVNEKDLFEHSFRVDAIVIHPKFKKEGIYSNDIGLLKVRTPHTTGILFNSHVRSICLPDENNIPLSGTWCTITGWGAHGTGNLEPIADTLKVASVPILDLNACRRNFLNRKQKQEILDTMLCAGFSQGTVDACNGDSGGPLACEINNRFVLAGVVSWGDGCAKTHNPGVYTRISSYIGWIREAIKKLE